jgi:hypothetical protein
VVRFDVLRLALALTLALGVACPLRAATIDGVHFADQVTVRDRALPLLGTARLIYKWVFKGYVAAFYLEPGARPDRVLDDVAKRLEIEYFWKIGAADFARATDAGIAKNSPREVVTRLRSRIDRLNALYADVKPGDRYALTYLPGVGTELALNGAPRGTVPGADFATALFGIWLGAYPLDADLKRGLLGPH